MSTANAAAVPSSQNLPNVIGVAARQQGSKCTHPDELIYFEVNGSK
ncbi:hypothetical protein [Yersinia intermedia]|nr:hypothetical protein [Yersinia intermedia]